MSKYISELKNLFKHGAIYGAAEILSRIIGFLMIPVYTHYLKPSDYGIYSLVGVTIEVIGIILSLGIGEAVYRFYYDKEMEDSNVVISTAFVSIPIGGFFVLGGLSLLSKQLAGWVLGESNHWNLICLSLGTLWFNGQYSLMCTYLRLKERSTIYFVLSLAKLITSLSLNIYFIVFLEMGILGLFIANLIAACLFSVIGFPFFMKRIGTKFSLPIFKKMLRFSLPIIPANLASLAVNASDRYFVKAFLSLADVGIYTLGYRLGSVVFYLIRVPFMQIWEPRRYAFFRDGAPPEIYARIATYFISLMIFFGLGISVFAKDAIKIISPQEYWSGASYVPAVVLCYIVYSMDNHVGFGIMVAKKTEYWTYVNLTMGALNLILNYLLISRYGLWGAVLATFLSLVFKIVALYKIGNKLFQIPFEWVRMAGLLTVSIIIYFLSTVIYSRSLVTSFVIDSLMVMLFFPSIWIIGLIRPEEKKWIIKVAKKLIPSKAMGAF